MLIDRSHAPRGNAACDALRHDLNSGRIASRAAFLRRAWERSNNVVAPNANPLTTMRSESLLILICF
ncbi:hypothetical protein PspCFBP13528_25960 [Pseudomonas sp. CFBP13528]|nr:hypothetical protein PspCFBP13528_25960 [Pseudomonas sp. CFBP13528]